MKLVIDIQDIHKSFGSNHVLKGINLQVPEGTTTVIIGASGSGKSVLMKHIIGLLRPDSGKVTVDGIDMGQLSERELSKVRERFGMVFQGAALFDSMTVGENVAFPLREHRKMSEREIRKTVAEKLAMFDLSGTEKLFPAELSGGMRKRVGLARAIVLSPRIVLYDEPTTGLDPITTDSVDDMIISAKKQLGITSVVISHDIASSFRVADHVAMIHDGVIVDQGKPQELRQSSHPYVKKFLSTWFEKGD
jgi:phospholipid/cholesterol/gamma-HCH transport system ATP-binding protein